MPLKGRDAQTPRMEPRGIIMAHRSRNPRPQKDESCRLLGHSQKQIAAYYSPPRSSYSPRHRQSVHLAHHSARSSQSPSPPCTSPDHRTRECENH